MEMGSNRVGMAEVGNKIKIRCMDENAETDLLPVHDTDEFH